MSDKPMSPKQQALIKRLVEQKFKGAGYESPAEMLAAITMERNITALTGGFKGTASEVIDYLFKLEVRDPDMPEEAAKAPRSGIASRRGSCVKCGQVVEPQEGYYFGSRDAGWETIHRVGKCPKVDPNAPKVGVAKVEPGWYTLGEQVIQIYVTRNGRLAGKEYRGPEEGMVYLPGAVALVRGAGVPMGTDELAKLATEYALATPTDHNGEQTGSCIFCAQALTDPRSNPFKGGVGYGPICAGKNGLPWG